MFFYRKFASLCLLLCFTTVAAQATTCSAIAQQAMAAVQTSCASTGRNQACYGYVSLQATPRAGVSNFSFAKAGDLANIADLASLQLTALDPAKNTWGIALMKLQANLPDTLPGENVTFLMFGDVQIKPGQSTADHPLQAFYFKTGINQTACTGVPADGILVQTPKGAGQIQLRLNDVDIQLGSTAFFQAQPAKQMSVKVVEGKGHITSKGKTVVVPAGSQVEIPISEDLSADGEPTDPQPYDPSDVVDLPVSDLPDEITIAPPADAEEIQQALDEASAEMTDQAPDAQAGDLTTDEAANTNVSTPEDSLDNPTPTDAGQDQPPADNPTDSSGG